ALWFPGTMLSVAFYPAGIHSGIGFLYLAVVFTVVIYSVLAWAALSWWVTRYRPSSGKGRPH
ncbi:MAG: hypothetical protein ACREDR_17465, partial [Blastocatellia bacterium]